MHQEAATDPSAEQGGPKGLLQQMEELMAALTADLSRLDADLQSSAARATDTATAAGDDDVDDQAERGADHVSQHAF
ncbi:hypothetical protein [Streptomyces sp. XD-27]|uniref:hypothetical protein n=1 Tax=Streptomyces sp. XD-27 TaxID=3062779 RepID=UPI0026F45312|nr:hypothetical protein [Streptomyces sp. XD-27]WKX73049.1 hypothetical protein Q3Y56_26920 [Streptomyces sp. XD-27]